MLWICIAKRQVPRDEEQPVWVHKLTNQTRNAMNNVDPKLYAIFRGAIDDHEFPFSSSKDLKKFFDTDLFGKVGLGFLIGYPAGYFLRRVSRVLTFMLGGVVTVMQVLAYMGYITVNYDKVERDVFKALDTNKDESLDARDWQCIHEKAREVLSDNIPCGSGFTTGFWLGMR
jgi:FUN14 domain-containing protein 1